MLAAVAASAALPACGTTTDILQQPAALVTNGISTLSSVELPKVALPESDTDPIGSPLELYNRVARGATRCWFGAEGHLKPTHIFNAIAEPEGKGASASIVIHERDPKMPDPRGNRAFTVEIKPSGDSAKVTVENIRFPLDEGQRMEREIRRWARDDQSCSPRAGADTAARGALPTPPQIAPAPAAKSAPRPAPAPTSKPAQPATAKPSQG